MIQHRIERDIKKALQAMFVTPEWEWPSDKDFPDIPVYFPEEESEAVGTVDYISPVALQIASVLKKPSMEVAGEIRQQLQQEYAQVNIVHPGVLLFSVSDEQLLFELEKCVERGEVYGKVNAGRRQKVAMVVLRHELTAPLPLKEARGAMASDTLGRMMTHLGYRVHSFALIEDWGPEVQRFGESVTRRWLQQQGVQVAYEDSLASGAYIRGIAQRLTMRDYKLSNLKKIEWVKERITEKALRVLLSDIQDVCEHSMHVHIQEWVRGKKAISSGMDVFAWSQEHNVRRLVVAGRPMDSWRSTDEMQLESFAIPPVEFTRKGVPARLSQYMDRGVAIEELIDAWGEDAARFALLLFPEDEAVIHLEASLFEQASETNPYLFVQAAVEKMRECVRQGEASSLGVGKSAPQLVAPELREFARVITRYPAVLWLATERLRVSPVVLQVMDVARHWIRISSMQQESEEYQRAMVFLARAGLAVCANASQLLQVQFDVQEDEGQDQDGDKNGYRNGEDE